MKVKWVIDKNMMNNLVWVKKHNFPNATMNFFGYQNPKWIYGGGVAMKMLEFGGKIHDDDAK